LVVAEFTLNFEHEIARLHRRSAELDASALVEVRLSFPRFPHALAAHR